MVRQRLRIGSSPLALLGRIVLVLFALALVWYGAMLVLLAFKVSPHTVNQLSGYRSAYNYLAGLEPQDITDDILFGAKTLLALEALWAEHLLGSWREGRTSLTQPLELAVRR